MSDVLGSDAQSKSGRYLGYTLGALVALFFLMDGAMKFSHAAPVVAANSQLEIPLSLNPVLGVLALLCLLLYAIPATSILGALLFTGYLGGAIAIHARVGSPLFTHTLFPIYAALFVWGAIWFRDQRLRDQFPLVKKPVSSASSKGALYTGYALTALSALFILFSAVMKFVYTPPAGSPPPAFPVEHLHTLAYIEFVLVALYLVPRTAFFGAVFLVGYLGGATAIGLRAGEGVAGAMAPVITGVVLWLGLWLRSSALRELLPLSRR